MIRLLIHLAALPFCLTELSKTSVHQTPTAMIKDAGEDILMNCSHSNTAFDMIQWYKQSAGENDMALIGYVRFTSTVVEDKFKDSYNVSGHGSSLAHLHIPTSRSENSAVYFCAASRVLSGGFEAFFGGGTKLTVLEKDKEITGPSVKVLQPSPKECKNEKDKQRKKTLVCVAKDFYPDHVSVSWEINGQNVTNGVATDEAAQLMPEKKFYQITSRLRVPAKDWENSDNEFKCIVNFFNKTHTVPYTDSIYGEAVTTTNVMTREKYVKITQAAKLTYSVFIAKSCIYGAFVVFLVWKLQGSKGKQNY